MHLQINIMAEVLGINKEGTKVIITIRNGLLCQKTTPFVYECGSDVYAELLASHLNKKIGDAIEQVRKTEYEQGWRDKAKKKPKRNWFPSWWEHFYRND